MFEDQGAQLQNGARANKLLGPHKHFCSFFLEAFDDGYS
jgi:hypothetical protein